MSYKFVSELIWNARGGNLDKVKVEQGRVKEVDALLKHEEVDVNITNDDGDTALMKAIEKGDLDVVRVLLNHKGVDVNAKDKHCDTALMKAIEKVSWETLLAYEEVDVNVKNRYDQTARMKAIEQGHLEVVRALLNHKEKKVDVNIENEDGDTALILASKYGNAKVVNLLLSHEEVDVNVKNKYGKTALMKASEKGRLEVVGALLKHEEVDVNVQNYNDDTALMKASEQGHLEVVDALLKHKGVDVNVRNMFSGDTALIKASEKGRVEVVGALLEHEGVDVNIKNNDGDTALMKASKKGYAKVLRVLLKHSRVDVKIENKDGETALDVARKEKNDDVARLLDDFGVLKVDEHDIKWDVQTVPDADGTVKMDLDKSTVITLELSHTSIEHPSAFPNVVSRLGMSCVPCRLPCIDIKLLELIDHRRVGSYGLFRRKHVLNTVEQKAETLIDRVEDDQREELKNLVEAPSTQRIIAPDVTQSAGFMSGFHATFPLRNMDLASVGLKGTHEKCWSLTFNDGRITRKSVSEMDLMHFLDEHGVPVTCKGTCKMGVVTVLYSVTGRLTYVGDSRLVAAGGGQLHPTPTGPVKIMEGCEYAVTDSGQVVLSETNPVERIIGIEFLKLETTDAKKELVTQ